MERRRFLQLLGLGVGGIALEQAIPLGRVWSFPKKIVIGEQIGSMVPIRIPQRWFIKDEVWSLIERPARWVTEAELEELRRRYGGPMKTGDKFAIAGVNAINPIS